MTIKIDRNIFNSAKKHTKLTEEALKAAASIGNTAIQILTAANETYTKDIQKHSFSLQLQKEEMFEPDSIEELIIMYRDIDKDGLMHGQSSIELDFEVLPDIHGLMISGAKVTYTDIAISPTDVNGLLGIEATQNAAQSKKLRVKFKGDKTPLPAESEATQNEGLANENAAPAKKLKIKLKGDKTPLPAESEATQNEDLANEDEVPMAVQKTKKPFNSFVPSTQLDTMTNNLFLWVFNKLPENQRNAFLDKCEKLDLIDKPTTSIGYINKSEDQSDLDIKSERTVSFGFIPPSQENKGAEPSLN